MTATAAVQQPGPPQRRDVRIDHRSPNTHRTLPIRLTPLPGESLESWLAALAIRMDATWNEMLATVLPTNVSSNTPGHRRRIGTALMPTEVTSITAVTGLGAGVVRATTLAGIGVAAIRIDETLRAACTPWGAIARQRYCPTCLSETQGRWLLDWRLPWVTVCPRHHCFLADACPACGRTLSTAGLWFRHHRNMPAPLHCPCGAKFTSVRVPVLPDDHPAIRLQQKLSQLSRTDTIRTGIYQIGPVSSGQLLSDLNTLALRILRDATPRTLAQTIRARSVARETQRWSRLLTSDSISQEGSHQFARWATAPVVNAGVTAALITLLSPTLEAAAVTLTRAAPPHHGNQIRPTRTKAGYRPSAALCAVEIKARSCGWDALENLRFRAVTALPCYPATPPAPADDAMLRAVPTMMWAPWTAALMPVAGPLIWPTRCQLLSWWLLQVGTRRTESVIRRQLHCTIARQRADQYASAMSRLHMWPRIATALTRLHDYLVDHRPPIDYQRRRRIGFDSLLLPDQWQQVCSRAGVRNRIGHLAGAAKIWLIERLSCMPAAALSRFDRAYVDRFLMMLTPALKREIDQLAAQYLGQHGIEGEPLVWSPPLAILGRAKLAGVRPTTELIATLRAHLGTRTATVPCVANDFDVPVGLVRHMLSEHPLPPRRNLRTTWSQLAARALTEKQLRHLYVDEGLTLTEIARRCGMPRPEYVARRARACGIALRHEARSPIPAAWIREHHLNRRQTVGEMADELGDTSSRLRYWANIHGIKLRKYYRRAPNADTVSQAEMLGVADLLGPALSDNQAWVRLCRFALATKYSTVSQAAAALGCRSDTLSRQIKRLERDFDAKLIQCTASRKVPMVISQFGDEVADAVLRVDDALSQRRPGRPTGRKGTPYSCPSRETV